MNTTNLEKGNILSKQITKLRGCVVKIEERNYDFFICTKLSSGDYFEQYELDNATLNALQPILIDKLNLLVTEFEEL